METTPVTADSDFHDMDWWCNNCGGESEIPFPESKTLEAVFVVCSHCSHPSAYGWCEKCGLGTQLEWMDFRRRPTVWHCESCGTEYQLPVDFYENPIRFQPEAFADLEKRNEKRLIREYGHINVTWIRRALLVWDKVRNIPLISSGLLLLFMGVLMGLVQPSKSFWMGGVAFFSLVVFCMAALIDVITFLVSKVFLLIYKIDKKWNG